jgi:DNA polymerase-3 subunit epsilon
VPARKQTRSTKRENPLERHLDESDFLVVDVETTGLSADAGDRVCEIGAVKLRGGAVIATFSSLINPQRPISAGAFAVNRISPQMVADAPVFGEIAGKLREAMEDAILVAYNAPFDLSFLATELRLVGLPPPGNAVVDALVLARQLLPGLARYPQGDVARLAGIPFPVKHRALDDAMVTGQLLLLFTSILKAHGCTTCADLLRRDLVRTLHAKRMTVVDEALREGKKLWIKYLSPANAEITDRIVTPTGCLQQESASYLVGFCHLVNGERNFRIDRILDLRVVETFPR